MADVVASGVLNSVLDRLTNRMVEGRLVDVGAELKKLEGTLSTIRDVLADAEERQVQDKALIGWLRRLKDVAYDIDDLLDKDFAKNRKRSLTDPESSTTSWMKGTCGLKELNGHNLEGILSITSLENVKNFQQAREAKLIEMDGLKVLSLRWDLDTYKKQMEACIRTDVEGRSRQGLINALAVAEEVLDGLQPHENLTLFAILHYPGKNFPKWLESSLPNLVQLQLSSCFRCETLPRISQLHNLETLYLKKLPAIKSLPPLGQLPALKVLHLVSLLAVNSLGSEFYGPGDGAFPVLENLSLEHMPELEEWCEASAGRRSFPRLSELRLLDCPKLKELPTSFPSVEQLYLCTNSELLLSYLPRGAFPNLK
ncbi:putative disease resistance RPP13-like protein 1, partial [Ananas comosus]